MVSEEDYDAYLDDVFGSFTIGGITFDASRILKEVDPVAYRVGKRDYESYLEDAEEE